MNAPTQIQKLVRDTNGAGFVEYIILVGLVALLAMAGYRAFGNDVKTKIQDQGTQVQGIN